ncbi:DUF169 domain-containing protein [Candidatus Omnitrophota bacterium]
MDNKEWKKFSLVFKELLDLELSPVAVARFKKPLLESFDQKVRICRAILEAGRGQTLQVSRKNNACFGAAWHLGFHQLDDPKTVSMIKKFVVEGEKLFSSYRALDNLMPQMGEVADNADSFFLLSPMEKCEFKPELVIFISDAQATCRLLTLATFIDGSMPEIKIGGPTCRMAVMYPLMQDKLNISFYDYTARKMCNVPKDKLLVSIPYKRVTEMIKAIDKCSAGKAKIEYPQEFREFLQRTAQCQDKNPADSHI